MSKEKDIENTVDEPKPVETQNPSDQDLLEEARMKSLIERRVKSVDLMETLLLRISWSFFLCLILCIVCLVFSAFVYTSSLKKEPKYFTKNQNGEYYEMLSLDQPSFEDSWVSQFAVEALVKTFNFSFADYKLRLNDAYTKYYTRMGRTSIQQRLDSKLILKSVIQNELFFSMAITEAPIIQNRGVKDGQFIWEVHAKGVLTYRNSKGSPSSQKIKIVCWVVRVDSSEFPSGMAIESLQWVSDDAM